ncbi:MAG: alginate export family protein, partial [Verrucomicrobia bacterium]|nr:alginate export family protein [Verrucomicrobiota bacterium]
MKTKTTLPFAALLAAASGALAVDTYTVTEGGMTTTYDATPYYAKPLAYSTTRDPDPPKYVTPATKSPWSLLNLYSWLDAGLDYRLRYEYRDDDIRRTADGVDQPFLHRTRLYLGVRDIVDPLRFAVEIQDAHRYNGNFIKDNRDINELEPIRAYAELYFKNVL